MKLIYKEILIFVKDICMHKVKLFLCSTVSLSCMSASEKNKQSQYFVRYLSIYRQNLVKDSC